MPLPDLSDLAGWQQVLGYFILAVSLGGIAVISRFGFIRGRTSPPESRANSAEISMVAIDGKAVAALAGEVSGLAIAVTQLNAHAGRYLEDMRVARDEAELEAARREGFEEGRRVRRRPPPKRRPKTTTTS